MSPPRSTVSCRPESSLSRRGCRLPPVYEYRDTVGEEGPGAARTREGGRLSERKARYMLREAARKVTL
jgi:hypothetical protein